MISSVACIDEKIDLVQGNQPRVRLSACAFCPLFLKW